MKYLRIFLSILLFLLTLACKAQDDNEQLLRDYSSAMKANDYKLALSIVNKLIEADSSQASYFFVRAQLYQVPPDASFLKAFSDFSKAIQLDDTVVDYYFKRAELVLNFHEEKKLSIALEDFSKTLQLDSDYYFAYEHLHSYYIYRDTKKAANIRKLARQRMQHLVDADSLNATNWFYLGKAYDLLDDNLETKTNNEKCIQYYSKAIELNSTTAEYFWERGTKYYFFRKDYIACMDDMSKAIFLHDSYIYHLYISLCYENLKDLDKAMEAVNKGLAAFPNHWQLVQQHDELKKKMKK